MGSHGQGYSLLPLHTGGGKRPRLQTRSTSEAMRRCVRRAEGGQSPYRWRGGSGREREVVVADTYTDDDDHSPGPTAAPQVCWRESVRETAHLPPLVAARWLGNTRGRQQQPSLAVTCFDSV